MCALDILGVIIMVWFALNSYSNDISLKLQ